MKKKLKISYNAPVALTFILICFATMTIGYLTGGRSTQLLFMTYHSSLLNPLTYLRLFTHVLGHAGWSHFIGNASYILLLGPMLEEKYGSKTLMEIICITAFVTGLVNYVFRELRLLLEFRAVRRERSRICIHRPRLLHRIQGGRDPADIHPCRRYLHRAADLRRRRAV